MAIGDLTITDGNTHPSTKSGLNQTFVQIGEAVSGKFVPLYYKTTDGKYYKCISDDATKYTAVAFSWDSGSADDIIAVVTSGKIELGAILTKGRRYVVGATAGLVTLDSNLTTGDYAFTLGTADSTSVLNIDFRDDSAGVAI